MWSSHIFALHYFGSMVSQNQMKVFRRAVCQSSNKLNHAERFYPRINTKRHEPEPDFFNVFIRDDSRTSRIKLSCLIPNRRFLVPYFTVRLNSVPHAVLASNPILLLIETACDDTPHNHLHFKLFP